MQRNVITNEHITDDYKKTDHTPSQTTHKHWAAVFTAISDWQVYYKNYV